MGTYLDIHALPLGICRKQVEYAVDIKAKLFAQDLAVIIENPHIRKFVHGRVALDIDALTVFYIGLHRIALYIYAEVRLVGHRGIGLDKLELASQNGVCKARGGRLEIVADKARLFLSDLSEACELGRITYL